MTKAEKPVEPTAAEDRAQMVVTEAAANPVALFTDPKRYSEFYDRIKDAVQGHEPDLETDKGRRAIASLAFRVTKAKTTLDKAGLALTANWREQIKAVNESRFKMVAELDQLADEVRKPLTEWEQREEERLAAIETAIQEFRDQRVIGDDEDAAAVEKRGREIHARELDPAVFQERIEEAETEKAETVRVLSQAFHRMKTAEAERAELERLRREEEERRAREAEEAAKREAEERERREKEAAEQRDRELAEAARREAEERAAAEAKAREEEQRRAHEAELASAREREENARREAEALKRAEEERAAAAAAEERERLAREADRAHRQKVAGETKADLVELGCDQDLARKIVLAIAANEIRHVRISF